MDSLTHRTHPTSSVLMAEAWRGGVLDSIHHGVAAIANAQGDLLEVWGDTGWLTYPRSALKPIQATALAELGVFDGPGTDERHVAVSTASHLAEPFHVETVRQWLTQIGLDDGELLCGPDMPRNAEALASVLAAGGLQSRLYHNCSGKHTGFLRLAQLQGWPIQGYASVNHPAQQHYLDVLSDFIDRDARTQPIAVDGCRMPAMAMTVADFACAMARFASARVRTVERARAVHRVHCAMRAHPAYVSGTGTPSLHLIETTRGRVLVKTGAEGFLTAFVPSEGVAVALKILDGDMRVPFGPMLQILRQHGLILAREMEQLSRLLHIPVYDSGGGEVGCIRAALPSRSSAAPT